VSTQRERLAQKRREKLAAIREQLESGDLTIRPMTPAERALYPPRPAAEAEAVVTRVGAGAGLLGGRDATHAAGQRRERNRSQTETERSDERRAQKLRQVRRRMRERAAPAARRTGLR
jgi:hypothetical protein